MGELGVGAYLVGPDHQPAGQGDGAAGHGVADGGVDGHRFAGHHAAVDGGLAGQDLAVGGDPLPRADDEALPGPQQAGREPLLGIVIGQDADIFGASGG